MLAIPDQTVSDAILYVSGLPLLPLLPVLGAVLVVNSFCVEGGVVRVGNPAVPALLR
ncbi:MAG: hypothetical protein RMJ30_05255 [Nitrososphaerota archaeon]|nr:hypothetical protein [Nitrososphaerota archaeon]